MFAPVYRLLGRVGWLIVALFLFLVFAVTALTALYFYLRTQMAPWAAMGLIALIAGAASGIATLWATRSSSRRKPAVHVPPAAPALGLETLLRRAVSHDPVGAAIAAVAAGILIESVPQLSALVRRVSGQQHTFH
jgi:hypothetical protein